MNDHSPLWPTSSDTAIADNHTRIRQTLLGNRSPALNDCPDAWLTQWEDVWSHLAAWVVSEKQAIGGIPVFGIHGGQGSGKSTLSHALSALFRKAYGWNTVVVSIDDLYLGHTERQHLGNTVHPLLATRGVPGTHDHELGLELFKQLRQLEPGASLAIPKFDKVSDDRLPESLWHSITGPVDLIVFEGWCVGSLPVDAAELQAPINTLEQEEDANGLWRTQVNQALSNDYQRWFEAIDRLIMLKVPNMESVMNWRSQQEAENRRNTQGQDDRGMDHAALTRFIQHYERLTRNALRDLPERADLVLSLNSQHAVCGIE